jgi:hypothetical protein
LLSAALVEQHGSHCALALTESTMMASVLNTIAPLSVGFFASTSLTWRGGLALMLCATPLLLLAFGREK